jgi:hypothetical protein
MNDVTRRAFVRTSVGVAAGLTALDALDQADARGQPPDGPVVAIVRDPGKGEVSLIAGDREITLRDPQLVARLVRAAQ